MAPRVWGSFASRKYELLLYLLVFVLEKLIEWSGSLVGGCPRTSSKLVKWRSSADVFFRALGFGYKGLVIQVLGYLSHGDGFWGWTAAAVPGRRIDCWGWIESKRTSDGCRVLWSAGEATDSRREWWHSFVGK